MDSHPAASPSIGELGMLSDCRSAALVDRAGTVAWWCPERFDAPSSFGSLLGAAGGTWSLRPRDITAVSRAYLDDTLVLRTRFTTTSGVVEVTDGLLFAGGARGHEIGRGSPATLARTLACVVGEVTLDHRFDPRPDYGRTTPVLRREGSRFRATAGSRVLTLDAAGCALEERDGQGHGLQETIELRAGERRGFACGYGRVGEPRPLLDPFAALDDTARGWRSWTSQHERPSGFGAGQVLVAARVLQGLTHQETGAVIAAPTTSLPAVPGGDQNWDYRYAWTRDSSLVVTALRSGTCADEAQRYFSWLAAAALDGDPEGEGHTQALFGCDGERLLHEHEVDHLEGFAGSRPVRIGNGAFDQRQLDVYGHVLEAAAIYGDLGEYDEQLQSFLCQTASRAAHSWRLPDSGIWELRGEERHHTSSKLMCWVALDRAYLLAGSLGPTAEPITWRRERDAIARTLHAEAWDERRGRFAATLGGDGLDASSLLFVTSGFLAPSDPRARRLVDAVEAELADGGLVRRWAGGGEGGFLLCSFWLAQALALTGRHDRACEVFDRACAAGNDLGLLPEQSDPTNGEALGNGPLAISHAGLVQAVTTLRDAERRPRAAGVG